MLTRNATGPHAHLLDETDRPRLVRLCARLSGRPDAAEDLAQDTLLEAWRHRAQLVDPSGYWPWLTAIARHVCRRWARRHGYALMHERPFGAGADAARQTEEPPADDADVALGLERAELITLLDCALARLPPTTRAVLVARYVADWPQAAIAARWRLSEGAVEARLQRGKAQLRQLLRTDLRPEVESLGLVLPPRPAGIRPASGARFVAATLCLRISTRWRARATTAAPDPASQRAPLWAASATGRAAP